MLFACLFVPDFAVQAALRVNPPAIQIARPVAVLDGPASLPRVVALNLAARQVGIEIGMTMLQAAAGNSVLLHKRIPAQEEAAQQALLDCIRSFSPTVESTASGTVIADLSGVERLLGSPQKIGRELAASAAAMNFEVQVALAANPDAALVAARGFCGVTVIPSGEETVRL